MAQVTIDMCDHIIAAADKGERFPLTVNELRQLAYLARRQSIALEDVHPNFRDRTFPESQNRSNRVRKKLIKRFGGEFKPLP